MYKQESDIYSKLSQENHPHLIQYQESREDFIDPVERVNALGIVMEYAPHGTLCDLFTKPEPSPKRKMLRRSPFIKRTGNRSIRSREILQRNTPRKDTTAQTKILMEEKLVRTLFLGLLDAIEFMHLNGVSHLDLKMENILISKDFVLKITDFDLSRHYLDKLVAGRGTPSWRAPEVSSGSVTDFPAADVFSLGLILFTMLFGHPPFQELEKDTGDEFCELFRQFQVRSPKFWNIHQIEVSSSFKELIYGMLAEDPTCRWTLNMVRNSDWVAREVYSQQEACARVCSLVTNN